MHIKNKSQHGSRRIPLLVRKALCPCRRCDLYLSDHMWRVRTGTRGACIQEKEIYLPFYVYQHAHEGYVFVMQ